MRPFIGAATLRSREVEALPDKYKEESVEELVTRVLYRLRFAGEQRPFDTISLIYANVNEDDILLRKELDALVAANPRRIKLFYVLNNPPTGWTGGVGFVTKEHIKEYHPNPNDIDSKILICGE